MSRAKIAFAYICMMAGLSTAHAQTNITTYHVDNLRTGWNQSETTLTPANVGSSSFGLLNQVALDEQVDAQPLFVSGQTIAGQGTHDVVYVPTENNTIYAIDAESGAVLLSPNFGQAVSINDLPGGCNNNSAVVGINSTPVIDLNAGVMYVITYTIEHGQKMFRLHELSLSTLTDQVPSVVVSATARLKGGGKQPFQAAYQRQRAALLETSGNVYAGFASFCDIDANNSRGWVLGWNAGTLTPLPAAELMDKQKTDPDNFFLSSIWMSGYGLASDDQGSLFFVTGNSDYDGQTYNKRTNLAESTIRLSADLTTVQDYFTPYNHGQLDNDDNDFGSGGVMLLPTQAGKYPNLAVAAGKADQLFLMNRDKLGRGNAPIGQYQNNGCWCGPSYFVGSDGVGRVVSSTGGNIKLWKVETSPRTGLVFEANGPNLNSGQDPGFFSFISSNGTAANSAVIWALPHPPGGDPNYTISLTAFDPANGAAQIFSGTAGTWPNGGNANANLVPVAANGEVFVASYKSLSIFGLSGAKKFARFTPAKPPAPAIYTGTAHQLYGTVVALNGDIMTVKARDGANTRVDLAAARASASAAQPAVGHGVLVRGDTYSAGALVAKYVLHAKTNPASWGADR